MSVRNRFCTFLDVLNKFPEIVVESGGYLLKKNENQSNMYVRSIASINESIDGADAEIKMALWDIYGSDTEFLGPFRQAPYFTSTAKDYDNTNRTTNIRDVEPSESAYVEVWTVEITDVGTKKFTLTGSASGSQGTGYWTSDFTSTNEHIVIKASAWDVPSNPSVNQKLYFSICNAYPILRRISIDLATADLLDSIYSERAPNAIKWSDVLRKNAKGLLYDLTNPDKSKRKLPSYTKSSSSFINYAYDVDRYGKDNTDYSDDIIGK